MDRIQTILLWPAAIGALIMGGVFFAFSNFVMAGLARLPSAQGLAAMKSINVTVINPLFMTVFLGTGILCAALAGLSLVSFADPAALKAAVSALIYLVGCLGVTMVFNVPLNEALAAANPDDGKGAAIWENFLATWLFWNHARCAAAMAAGVLMISVPWA